MRMRNRKKRWSRRKWRSCFYRWPCLDWWPCIHRRANGFWVVGSLLWTIEVQKRMRSVGVFVLYFIYNWTKVWSERITKVVIDHWNWVGRSFWNSDCVNLSLSWKKIQNWRRRRRQSFLEATEGTLFRGSTESEIQGLGISANWSIVHWSWRLRGGVSAGPSKFRENYSSSTCGERNRLQNIFLLRFLCECNVDTMKTNKSDRIFLYKQKIIKAKRNPTPYF